MSESRNTEQRISFYFPIDGEKVNTGANLIHLRWEIVRKGEQRWANREKGGLCESQHKGEQENDKGRGEK